MKCEVQKDELINVLRMTERVSGRNLTLPVLNCVLLSVSAGKLLVRATNLDLGIETSISVKTEEEGVVAVSGSVLLNTLSALSGEKTVVLTLKEGNLFVKSKGGATTIKAQSHDDFPTIPEPGGVKITLAKDILHEGLKSVWYSASVSSVKPELSSVYVYMYDKKLYFVATDSFRLAEKSVPLKGGVPEFESFLIPFKNIPEIIRSFEYGEGGTVDLSLTQNQVSFVYDTFYLTSRLVDGSFPDYKQIIPKEFVTEAVLLKQDFVAVLKKATVFSDNFHQVRMKIDPGKKFFTLSAKNSDVGESTDTLPAALTGDVLEISFNYKYILDAFQSLHTDSVSLSFAGMSKPMVIRGVSDPSFLYLVMPMNK